jgi:hypothetical protein
VGGGNGDGGDGGGGGDGGYGVGGSVVVPGGEGAVWVVAVGSIRSHIEYCRTPSISCVGGVGGAGRAGMEDLHRLGRWRLDPVGRTPLVHVVHEAVPALPLRVSRVGWDKFSA